MHNIHSGIFFCEEKSNYLLLKKINVCLLRSNESSFGKKITPSFILFCKKVTFFLAKEDNEFLMSYYFNDLMSYQPKLINEKMQLMVLILLVFVSKNCQSGPLSSFAQHSRILMRSFSEQGPELYLIHCKWKTMSDMKVMFVFKHIDQKPFCNDKIHFKFIWFLSELT